MSRLVGHGALVTGGSSGIGRSIADAFADEGAAVVVHGRDDERPREASTLAVDLLSDSFDPARFVADAFDRLPQLDILVSCAGGFFDVPFLEMTADRFDRTWQLNVRAGYLIAAEVARRWHAAGTRGRMIFVGSVNGQLSEPASSAYDTSKAAVHGMVRALCVELAPLGIRVNGLAPGLIRTPLTRWLDGDPGRAAWVALHTPAGTIPGPRSCAGAAVFLASDDAEHVHGHVLNVDGGLSAIQYPADPASD